MVNDFKPHSGETERQYSWRICDYVKKGELTWQELADLVNKYYRASEEEYRTESAYRKPLQAVMAYAEEVFGDNCADDYYEKLLKLKDDIASERYKLQALKLESTRDNRINSRFELFYENIAKVVQKLEPPDKFNDCCYVTGSEFAWVLGIGDIHYGAKFSSINNSYSPEICERRFQALFAAVVNKIQAEGIQTLVIVNVGDTLQGILRMSDLQLNDKPVVESLVEVSRLLANFLNELTKYCYVEYYHVPTANHTQTRNLGSKASELAAEDMEYIISHYIADMLANNDSVTVYFNEGKEFVDFNIFGFNCFATHGHQLKNTKDVIKDMGNVNRKLYSYAFLGHTHSANEIIVGEERHNNIEVLTVPSFIGSDPYADKLMVGAKAAAKLYKFDNLYGHIGSETIILN